MPGSLTSTNILTWAGVCLTPLQYVWRCSTVLQNLWTLRIATTVPLEVLLSHVMLSLYMHVATHTNCCYIAQMIAVEIKEKLL